MGTTSSSPKSLNKGTIAFHVSSLGWEYKEYGVLIKENGIDGALLAEFDKEAFMETLDELEIQDKDHRKKLWKEFGSNFLKNADTSTSTKIPPSGTNTPVFPRNASRSPRRRRTRRSDRKLVGDRNSMDYSRSSEEAMAVLIQAEEELTNPTASLRRTRSDSTSLLDRADALESFQTLARKASEESLSLLAKAKQLEQDAGLPSYKRCRAPTCGNVAFVLTDVQGSTRLWEANPQAMRRAQSLHDKIIRRVSEEMHGYEIDTEGDAFYLAFHDAADAVRFCFRAQTALAQAPWRPEITSLPPAAKGLRVRMSVHSGPATSVPNPLTKRTQYEGPALRFVKSMEACTKGGQVLCSLETWLQANQTCPALKSAQMAVYGIHAGADGISKPLVEIAPSTGRLLTTSPNSTQDDQEADVVARSRMDNPNTAIAC